MDPDNLLNIPAFRRKKSISAKARKKPKNQLYIEKHKNLMDIPPKEEKPKLSEFHKTKVPTGGIRHNRIREMEICGTCDGYFEKIAVAVVKLTSPIRQGDQIIFETTKGLFEQTVKSMQENQKDIRLGTSGSEIGLKVAFQPKVGGLVYKVV